MTSLDITDNIHHFAFTGTFAAFVDNGEVSLRLPSARARTTPPTSGETTISSSLPKRFNVVHKHRRGDEIIGRNVEKSLNLTGMQARVNTRSAPADWMRFATSLAEMGVRGPGLRSWRA